MKTLQESLFDGDLVSGNPKGHLTSMREIENLLIDPLIKKFNLKIYSNQYNIKTKKFVYKQDKNTYKFCWKPENDRKNIALCFNVFSGDAKQNSWIEFNEAYIGDISIIYGRQQLVGYIRNVNSTSKHPRALNKLVKPIRSGDTNFDAGFLTYENIIQVKEYFENLLEQFYDLLDKNEETAKMLITGEEGLRTNLLRLKLINLLM